MTIPPAKIVDWHHSLADFMLQYPHASLTEIARHFGVTPIWIGVVRRSDAFQELMRTRRDVHSQLVSSSVISKVEALAEIAVEQMADRLSGDTVVPLETVREIGDTALKALGFGGRTGAAPAGPVQSVTVIVDREALAEARAKMMELRKPKEIEDASFVEIADDEKAISSS